MLKETIRYKDFNDIEREEDFYFNLNKAEVIELEFEFHAQGGLTDHLTMVTQSNNGRLIMDTFKSLVARSYGVKSADGRGFIKNKELSDGFMGSNAYAEFFTKLLSGPDEAAKFINGILPNQQEFTDTVERIVEANEGIRVPQDHLRRGAREQMERAEQETLQRAFRPGDQPPPLKAEISDEDAEAFAAWKAAQNNKEQTVTSRPQHENE